MARNQYHQISEKLDGYRESVTSSIKNIDYDLLRDSRSDMGGILRTWAEVIDISEMM